MRNYGFGDQLYMVISVVSGLVLYQVLFYLLRYLARNKKRELPKLLDRYIYFPGFFLMIVVAVSVGLLFVEKYFNAKALEITYQLIRILIIAGIGFLLIRILTVFREMTVYHYRENHPKDYRLRRVRTKFQLIQRVLNFVIILLAIGAILMTFQAVRQVGSTILASAGVVGLIVGFAAQKSIGSMFAGIQIALSEPIRIDDVVVVDGHFGVISEITLTYAILDKLDGKRLMIPINFFLENTFENWTRTSPHMLAKVYIYVDYSVPVEELRTLFFSLIGENALWDKRSARFLVTKSDAATVELRGTASAANSDDAFDLECQLREKLIAYIQERHPSALPKNRVELLKNE
jgi:small-conductance mechanosensitive channel